MAVPAMVVNINNNAASKQNRREVKRCIAVKPIRRAYPKKGAVIVPAPKLFFRGANPPAVGEVEESPRSQLDLGKTYTGTNNILGRTHLQPSQFMNEPCL